MPLNIWWSMEMTLSKIYIFPPMSNVLSIIMPVYNASQFLEETLHSILNQKWEHWELVAVDDFSSDDSYSILRAFAQKDRRITVHKNEKKGIIPALQKAFSNSTGQFVTRMDADDLMHPEKLEIMMKKIMKTQEACVTAKVKYFSQSTMADGYLRYANWLNKLIDDHNHYEEIYKECVIPSPCWMMSRATIEKIGGICSSRYPEDYDLVFRMYEHKVPIIGIDSVLHFWRDHSSRASRNDPHYADQAFIPLKLSYFKRLDYRTNRSLALWGAGRAGKFWAKALKKQNLPFSWHSNNPNKVNHTIYDKVIKDQNSLLHYNKAQILIAIKTKHFREENKIFLNQLSLQNQLYFLY